VGKKTKERNSYCFDGTLFERVNKWIVKRKNILENNFFIFLVDMAYLLYINECFEGKIIYLCIVQ